MGGSMQQETKHISPHLNMDDMISIGVIIEKYIW